MRLGVKVKSETSSEITDNPVSETISVCGKYRIVQNFDGGKV